MPYTPTSPTVRLCNDLVTYLQTLWGTSSPNYVARKWLSFADVKSMVGRAVVIYPSGFTNFPADRGFDFYQHKVHIIAARRYTDAADPVEIVPIEWVDQEADFVQQYLVEGLDFTHSTTSHSGTAPFNVNLQTFSNDCPDICDLEVLRQEKIFWCELDFEFKELILS